MNYMKYMENFDYGSILVDSGSIVHCKFVLECFDLFNIDKNNYIDNDSDSDDNDNDMIVKWWFRDFVKMMPAPD